MMELVLTAADADLIRSQLLGGEVESCAVLFAAHHRRTNGVDRLLVRELEFPAANEYMRRGLLEAELAPGFVARVVKRARRDGLALVFVHSHPGQSPPEFSQIDDDGEKALSGFLQHRYPQIPHAALVVSAGGWNARSLGSGETARLIVLGSDRVVAVVAHSVLEEKSLVFDRQVRAFGEVGQKVLGQLHVGIVGLGGTGSIVAQQLAHLGVGAFTLIDADTLEPTNLNRVAGATPQDIGALKVEIAARYIRQLQSPANVTVVRDDVMRAAIAKQLRDVDIIFGCTDSHGSRAVLQQVAYQYLIPCIDVGTTIVAAGGVVTHIYGRVQMLSPGHACLTCGGLLDANEVRRDMMTAFERQADPYIQGAREPAPAVMSINGMASSLAVTMMLSVATGVPMKGRHVLLNAMSPTIRSVRPTPHPSCFICSKEGALARADGWPLFARQD